MSYLQANADNDEEELNRQNAICIDDEEFVAKVNSYIGDQLTVVKTLISSSFVLCDNQKHYEELRQIIVSIK